MVDGDVVCNVIARSGDRRKATIQRRVDDGVDDQRLRRIIAVDLETECAVGVLHELTLDLPVFVRDALIGIQIGDRNFTVAGRNRHGVVVLDPSRLCADVLKLDALRASSGGDHEVEARGSTIAINAHVDARVKLVDPSFVERLHPSVGGISADEVDFTGTLAKSMRARTHVRAHKLQLDNLARPRARLGHALAILAPGNVTKSIKVVLDARTGHPHVHALPP